MCLAVGCCELSPVPVGFRYRNFTVHIYLLAPGRASAPNKFRWRNNTKGYCWKGENRNSRFQWDDLAVVDANPRSPVFEEALVENEKYLICYRVDPN